MPHRIVIIDDVSYVIEHEPGEGENFAPAPAELEGTHEVRYITVVKRPEQMAEFMKKLSRIIKEE